MGLKVRDHRNGESAEDFFFACVCSFHSFFFFFYLFFLIVNISYFNVILSLAVL